MRSKKFLNKNNLFLLLAFISLSLVYGQEKINQFDAAEKRTGIWEKYYNNQKIRYRGEFKAGKEIGTFKFYSPESSKFPIAIKVFLQENDRIKVSFFSVDGVLQSEGFMKGEERVGRWFYYHPDGKSVMLEENYEEGLLEGVSTTYYKSGKITETKNFNKGVLEGSFKRFSYEGVLLDDLFYKNGKLNGEANYYDINGNLVRSGVYENDEKVGNWRYFGKIKE